VAPARLARRCLNAAATQLERLLKACAKHDLRRLAIAIACPHHPPTPAARIDPRRFADAGGAQAIHDRNERMKRTALALLAALAAAPSAFAGDLSYTWLEAGYLRADPDGFDAENGFGIRGSGAITENLHVFGGVERVSFDTDFGDADLDGMRLGLGYNTALSDRVDAVVRAAYERLDADRIGDIDGYSIEAGVRGAFSPNFEGSAALRYSDLDDSDDTQLVLAIGRRLRRRARMARLRT